LYFPEALVVKSTVGFLVMLAAAIVVMIWLPRDRRILRTTILLIPILLYFGLSMMTRYQLGMRHLLPIIPLICVLIAMHLSRGRRVIAMLILMLLAATETAVVHPDYLAFFNFACGGASRGERYLIDSNLDWGQDLSRLAQWLKTGASGRGYS